MYIKSIGENPNKAIKLHTNRAWTLPKFICLIREVIYFWNEINFEVEEFISSSRYTPSSVNNNTLHCFRLECPFRPRFQSTRKWNSPPRPPGTNERKIGRDVQWFSNVLIFPLPPYISYQLLWRSDVTNRKLIAAPLNGSVALTKEKLENGLKSFHGKFERRRAERERKTRKKRTSGIVYTYTIRNQTIIFNPLYSGCHSWKLEFNMHDLKPIQYTCIWIEFHSPTIRRVLFMYICIRLTTKWSWIGDHFCCLSLYYSPFGT